MKTLISAFDKLKIPYDESLINRFQKHMELVLCWNEKINLTAITDKEEFIKKHYIDSLACYGMEELERANKIVDVGTGAGFPGIPLAMVYPEKKFVLIDSANKKLKTIEDVLKKLKITNVTTVHGRAEDLAINKAHREQYDFCVARAVAELNVLAEYCLPFIKIKGYLAAYKTKAAQDEISHSKDVIKLLGGHIKEIKLMEIEELQLEHLVLMIEKIHKTPAKYPRKAGIPKKQPLN